MAEAQRRLKADNLVDVVFLAHCVQTTPPEQQPALLAVVHDLDLMRFRWPHSMWAWIARRRHGRVGLLMFFRELQKRAPATVSAFIEQTAQHIASGEDREEKTSVGGLCQREIDLLQGSVRFSFLDEPAALARTEDGGRNDG